MSLKDSFFSRTASLTTGEHHGVRGLPPLEAPKTLWPQNTAAASTMEALNIVHSGSISPASTGMLEKLLRRWELKASQTGASPGRSTHVAAHPTPAVSPADGGSTGWGREKCHVALRAVPGRAPWQTWPPGDGSRALRPGLAPDVGPELPPGRVSCLTLLFLMGYFEPYLVWPRAPSRQGLLPHTNISHGVF